MATDRVPNVYLYRRGDGNEGNFARRLVELKPTDCPYAALAALVANDYIAGRRVRRHIVRAIELDGCGGDADSIHAMVADGPDGETAFGAAWLTAELEPVDAGYLLHMTECYGRAAGCGGNARPWRLREVLDSAALRQYRRDRKAGA